MEPVTRRERKDLRRLASIAYDRELGRELTRLEASFAEWHAGRLDSHDVSQAIHEFHDGVARNLWALYTHADPQSTVARAVAAGLLAESEVSPPLLAKMQLALEYYRLEAARSDADPPESDAC